MSNAYQGEKPASAYSTFLNSDYGQEFQNKLKQVFLAKIQDSLTNVANPQILDTGCGDGWLANSIASNFPTSQVSACDLSSELIELGKNKYQKVLFQTANLEEKLPYPDHSFDIVTASMVLHDLNNTAVALQNIERILKPEGLVFASIVNPYYGFPVGAWKRGVLGRLFGGLPKLKLIQNYNVLKKLNRPHFSWREGLSSNFTPLEEYLKYIKESNLYLDSLHELSSEHDEGKYSLAYQLYRFPIILLLTLKKIPK